MPLAGDAALLRILAMKEKVTVMERWMEGLMMETKGAKVPLCVAVIIVKSLEHTTMRRMIAVRDLPILATLLGILIYK